MGERRLLTIDDLSTEAGGIIGLAANWHVTEYISTQEISKKWCKFFEALGIFKQVDEFVSREGRKHTHYDLTHFGWKLVQDKDAADDLAYRRRLSDPRFFPPNVSLLWDDAPIRKHVPVTPRYQPPPMPQRQVSGEPYKSPKMTEAQKKLERWNAAVMGKIPAK